MSDKRLFSGDKELLLLIACFRHRRCITIIIPKGIQLTPPNRVDFTQFVYLPDFFCFVALLGE
jgi:hypothetical protein